MNGNKIDVDDRRKTNRIDAFEAGLQAVNGIDGDSIGIIGNLSAGGMMLITRRQLYADGVLQLKIEPPPALGIRTIPVGMKILWCVPANSPDEFWAGLETIDIADADMRELLRLLEHLSQHR
ncbi:MAG: PilZ domain-containing protein [Chromatiaceae bacterium]|nr:PilZ domain-containing protein [Gammaproteobacteria bacterium]MCP5300025.1 PilZ domain-containing protein [Chromatiaceae bacterium]MCP5422097.1 PilZ domain-containing protein [Chromatiaceae bacterium]